MVQRIRFVVSLALIAVIIGGLASNTGAQGRTKIRYALGDVISIDELPLLIAVDHAKARGVDVVDQHPRQRLGTVRERIRDHSENRDVPRQVGRIQLVDRIRV